MCVAAIAWDAHPDWLLVAIGNRDEFHARPSSPLALWQDGSSIIAGRDLRAGGTWLGVSEAGRFALLTNFRDSEGHRPDRASRGELVTGFLSGRPETQIDKMNAFNLFCADANGAQFVTNFPRPITMPLSAGLHGISNGPFGEPWPKTQQLGAALDEWLRRGQSDFSKLFAALRAETPRPLESTPPHVPAPNYAPVFIRGALYGTRCSTIVAITRDLRDTIIERSFDSDGLGTGERRIDFRWPDGDRSAGEDLS